MKNPARLKISVFGKVLALALGTLVVGVQELKAQLVEVQAPKFVRGELHATARHAEPGGGPITARQAV